MSEEISQPTEGGQVSDKVEIPKGPLAELIHTEAAYIEATGLLTPENITKVMNEYNKNAKAYAKKDYATASELKSFLENIAALSKAHQSVLTSFKDGNYNEGIKKVGELHSAYVEITIQSNALLTKIPPEVNNILKNEPGFRSRTLDTIASLPFQRVPRYSMTLLEALKHSFKPPLKDHVRADLEAAAESAKTAAADINTSKALYETQYPLMLEIIKNHLKQPNNVASEGSFLRALKYEIDKRYKASRDDTSYGKIDVESVIKYATNAFLKTSGPDNNAKNAEAFRQYYTKVLEKVQSGELKSVQDASMPPVAKQRSSSIPPVAKQSPSRIAAIAPSFARKRTSTQSLSSSITTEISEKVDQKDSAKPKTHRPS